MNRLTLMQHFLRDMLLQIGGQDGSMNMKRWKCVYGEVMMVVTSIAQRMLMKIHIPLTTICPNFICKCRIFKN